MAECLVIGLDEQHFSNFCKRNEPTGIDFKTFPRRQRRSAGSHTKRCGFAWSGLLNASDRSGWRQCLSRGEVLAVFEDGARLRDDFETQLQTLLQRVTAWDLILFGCNMDTGVELAVTPHVSLNGRFSIAYPQLEHLAEFTKIRDAVELCRVLLAFGICGYAIGPRGADRLLPHCFPLDSRPVRLAASARRIRAYGVDCMMADAYPKIRALLCWPPLVYDTE